MNELKKRKSPLSTRTLKYTEVKRTKPNQYRNSMRKDSRITCTSSTVFIVKKGSK